MNISSDTLLQLENVSWGVEGREILSDISFSITPGEFVGLIGPNGSGKSSLLRCIYRVNTPTAGNIVFQDRRLSEQSLKESARHIAVILQEHSDHLGLNVEDIVGLGLTPHKGFFQADSADDRKRIRQLLQEVDLLERRHATFALLSGGEKQRVMLARAMLQAPSLLLMDEPTNHLDVHYQIDVLQKVREAGLSVLASFHDLNLAAAFCDRILVLNQGALVADGTPETVLTEDRISKVFHTCALVDEHPIGKHPRISYAYHVEKGPR